MLKGRSLTERALIPPRPLGFEPVTHRTPPASWTEGPKKVPFGSLEGCGFILSPFARHVRATRLPHRPARSRRVPASSTRDRSFRRQSSTPAPH